ncbi:MAG: hypothetical protein ACOX5Z_12420 [Desulfobulbus sp.]
MQTRRLYCTGLKRKRTGQRRSKFESKTAAAFNEAPVPRLRAALPALRQTLTLDSSSEMARFKELKSATAYLQVECTA